MTFADISAGSFGLVWTPATFLFAFAYGFGFGYLVIASISAQPKWSTQNKPRVVGWIVGVLAGWFLTGLLLSETVAALVDGDTNWPRLISRMGPYLVTSLGLGLGVWRGLHRAAS